MNYAMTHDVVGYHGTNSNLVESIVADSFRKSENDDEWLGHGVYFFVEGISCPITNAGEWAKNQAFSRKGNRYDRYTVLEAVARCNRLLDATTVEGLQAFEEVRQKILEKHDEHFVKGRVIQNDNCVMWNLVARLMGLDAVIHNLYIKNRMQRIKQVQSNVPNTTVLCVKNPDSIDSETIRVVDKGVV